VAQLSTLGALTFEHEEDTEHTILFAGGRPDDDVMVVHRVYDFILDCSGGDLPVNVVTGFERQRLLGCEGYCDCHISFRYGSLAHTISVGALLPRVA
jgi:hypothetical protein